MLDRQVVVQITWVGPRTNAPPIGLEYLTFSRFPEDGNNWPKKARRIVLSFGKSPFSQGQNPIRGFAHFLSPKAPQARLAKGKSFTLHEQGSEVAQVRVI